MLEVQRYLNKKSLADLESEFNIRVRKHEEYDNVYSLTYNMVKSPMHRKIVRECRGLVINAETNEVLFRGYDKFFNYGENYIDDPDLDTLKIYPKLDGSFIGLYFYDNKWHTSTTGTPDGSGFCELANCSFSQLFWRTFNALNYKLPENPQHVFMFELMTPYNQVVVQHKTSNIVLHGFRDNKIWVEQTPENLTAFYPELNWEVVERLNLKDLTWENLKQFAARNDGDKDEGIVASDAQFNRVKIKNYKYVLFHHKLTNFSFKSALEILFAGEVQEVVAYKPEFAELFRSIETTYSNLLKAMTYAESYCVKNCKNRSLAGLWFSENKTNKLLQFAKGYIFHKVYDGNCISPEEYLLRRYCEKPTQVKKIFKLSPTLDSLFNE